eukprot:scaffold57656_cov61-Attheya_sp.AAC.3
MANESERKINDDAKEELTPEERIAWLRERVRHRFASFLFSYLSRLRQRKRRSATHYIYGSLLERKTNNTFTFTFTLVCLTLTAQGVLVETSEERKGTEMKHVEVDGEEYRDVSFVHVPQDESVPMKQLTTKVRKSQIGKGDVLMEELKPLFSTLSNNLDLNLLRKTHHFGSGHDGSSGTVSQDALKAVAEQGQVESFCLVQPMPPNKFTSVNIYLDEVGLLKRLPLNKRAGDMALKAGFNPAPKFYGDVFIGRLKSQPVLTNVDFKLGVDTSSDAEWLQRATMQNLEYQTAINSISGKTDQVQPSADGEDGVAKAEEGGLYSWTQTDEEIELIVPLGSSADGNDNTLTSKDVKAGGLKLYASVDPDGCTWTLDTGKKQTSLNISCEKIDAVSWPRITH